MKKMILNNSVAGLLSSSFAGTLQKQQTILPLSLKRNTSTTLYSIITSLSSHIYANADVLINNKIVFSFIQLPK
jgi:hypothetical protein